MLVKNPVQWCSAIQNGGGWGKGGGGGVRPGSNCSFTSYLTKWYKNGIEKKICTVYLEKDSVKDIYGGSSNKKILNDGLNIEEARWKAGKEKSLWTKIECQPLTTTKIVLMLNRTYCTLSVHTVYTN